LTHTQIHNYIEGHGVRLVVPPSDENIEAVMMLRRTIGCVYLGYHQNLNTKTSNDDVFPTSGREGVPDLDSVAS
jgi:hypothetical protein